ncbi:MAG: hypothetical protein AAFU41_15500 [Pseudomonadota bacterium]
MRLTVLALTLLPFAAQAQTAPTPAPDPTVAQTQSCPAGTAWDAASGACAAVSETATPAAGMGGHAGCGFSAGRELSS